MAATKTSKLKSKNVLLRLSPREKRDLQAAAKANEMTMTRFILVSCGIAQEAGQ